MRPFIYSLVFYCCIFGCKNSSEENQEGDDMTIENTTSSDTELAIEENINLKESLSDLVDAGQITQAQADKMLKQMEGFDPEKFGDSLSSVLGDFENSLKTGEVKNENRSVLPYTKTYFKTEKERGLENLRTVLGYKSIRYVEEVIGGWFGFSREKRKRVLRSLASESITKSKADLALLEFFEVSEEELKMLKTLPASEKIFSESEVKAARDYILPQDIAGHLKSGNASESFIAVIDRFNYNRGSTARRFLPQVKKARETFYKLNPAWYGDNEEAGDTYLDSHRNYIYLPLGALSFADKLVAHEMEIENGTYPLGALGEPDMAPEILTGGPHPKFCNLGTKGVLTLEFTNNAITNVNGPDLFIFEMGAIEPTNLEISKNGVNWIDVGKIEGGTAMVDIEAFVKPKETFTYIRLTDLVTRSDLPGADVDAVAAIGGALRLNLDSSVLFDTGKFQLKESASQALESLLTSIQEIPEGTIIIEGHTDNVGSPSSNKTLSVNRAQEVSNYLKKHLSKKYKYQEKGFGETQPVAPNDTDENRQKNRRVEILVIPSK